MQRLVKEKLLMVIFEVKINLFHRKRRKEIEIDGWRLARRSGKVVKIVCGIIADRLAKGGAPKKKKKTRKKRKISRGDGEGGKLGNYLTHNLNFAKIETNLG